MVTYVHVYIVINNTHNYGQMIVATCSSIATDVLTTCIGPGVSQLNASTSTGTIVIVKHASQNF